MTTFKYFINRFYVDRYHLTHFTTLDGLKNERFKNFYSVIHNMENAFASVLKTLQTNDQKLAKQNERLIHLLFVTITATAWLWTWFWRN